MGLEEKMRFSQTFLPKSLQVRNLITIFAHDKQYLITKKQHYENLHLNKSIL